jgi:formylglycine-generating enzyme required for sulfatase activity
MEGRQLGDYVLLRFLSRGALGETYLAEHRFLKRPFIVKILDKELSHDADFVQKLQQEATWLATLEHPHIVKVHNVSEADGAFFLVTDPTLDEKGAVTTLYDYFRQKGGRLAEEEIVRFAHQIAEALDYTHEKGKSAEPYAHRGLNLSNIFITKKREGVAALLADFGLAKILGGPLYTSRLYQALAEKVGQPLETLPSQSLSFLHHFLCMAPEQKWEKMATSGAKVDTYAFGVLIYFLLTGKHPEGAFELPSQLSPHYKLAWDGLVQQCLSSNPSKRPTLLKALLDELSPTPQVEKPNIDLKPLLKPGEIQRPEYESDPGAIFKAEMTIGKYQPQVEETHEIMPLHSEMTILAGGTFFRGSNTGGRDEMPRHQIVLDPYALDVHPITNEQFVFFLTVMGGEKDHNNNDIIRLRESRIKRVAGKLSIESGYAKHPVVGVTYYGAIAYAKWVGKRLPTEAEWEIGALGGLEESIYPTGSDIDRTQANFFSSDTTPVMSYPPNGYGLYDMAGNVYQWCLDWYDYHYYNISLQEPSNPKGPLQGVYRVLRGGCWKSLKEDLRCSHRHRNNPGTMNGTYGFRCAADVN